LNLFLCFEKLATISRKQARFPFWQQTALLQMLYSSRIVRSQLYEKDANEVIKSLLEMAEEMEKEI
jgi:hypothetical protein